MKENIEAHFQSRFGNPSKSQKPLVDVKAIPSTGHQVIKFIVHRQLLGWTNSKVAKKCLKMKAIYTYKTGPLIKSQSIIYSIQYVF